MGLPGTTELLLISGVVIMLFGAKKLPKLGGAIGESIRNFKQGVRADSVESAENSEVSKTLNA